VGADVQKDRIEATLMGWGLNDESWAIDHKIFRGDPAKQEIWDEFDAYTATDVAARERRDHARQCAS
jgi:phage terminase large subunit GpA-like protein